MTTMKVFKLGNSQAVRIPSRYRFKVTQVDVFEHNGDLILRPKAANALAALAPLLELADLDIKRPSQGKARPTPILD